MRSPESAASGLNPGRIEREGTKKGGEGQEINKLTLQHLVSTYYKRESYALDFCKLTILVGITTLRLQ
tara:strand:+ start:225 stop:428 length:204 start_codon:yes stop_codon:yes gene_type:complete